MIYTLATYIEYFRLLATAHMDIQSFVVGGVEEILARDRSALQYPCLWLEIPDIVTSYGDAHRVSFKGALVIMHNSPIHNPEERLLYLERLYQIVRDVQVRMIKDGDDMQLFQPITEAMEIHPIATLGQSGDIGWRLIFDIHQYPDPCDRLVRFTSGLSGYPIPSFSYDIEDDRVYIKDIIEPEIYDERAIYIRSTKGEALLSIPDAYVSDALTDGIILNPAWSHVFILIIVYTVTDAESVTHEIPASTTVFTSIQRGYSVPYIIKI